MFIRIAVCAAIAALLLLVSAFATITDEQPGFDPAANQETYITAEPDLFSTTELDATTDADGKTIYRPIAEDLPDNATMPRIPRDFSDYLQPFPPSLQS